MLTVMGLDPGTENCAFSISNIEIEPFRYKIVTHGMIKNPIKDLNGLHLGDYTIPFKREIRGLKEKYGVGHVTAERYMTRGHGGTTIEAVSLQLGIVASLFGPDVCLIPAAVWKNAFNMVADLKELYADLAQYGIPTHRIDAVCIGLYGATMALDEPHFQMLKNIKQFKNNILKSR